MSFWLKVLLIVAACSTVSACGNQSVLKADEIRLGLPTNAFVNSPYFKKTFQARILDQVQLESTFPGETTSKYKVTCISGLSHVIRIAPPENLAFSRERALKEIEKVMPQPGLKPVETDSEDLEKLDSKRHCEHFYFQDGVYAELHYSGRDITRVTGIHVSNRLSEMPL